VARNRRFGAEQSARERPVSAPVVAAPPPVPVWPVGPAEHDGLGEHVTVINHAMAAPKLCVGRPAVPLRRSPRTCARGGKTSLCVEGRTPPTPASAGACPSTARTRFAWEPHDTEAILLPTRIPAGLTRWRKASTLVNGEPPHLTMCADPDGNECMLTRKRG